MRQMIDTKCEACGKVVKDTLLDPKAIPACECGGVREHVLWVFAKSHGIETDTAIVVDDNIPGGIMIEHGICNADGTPRRYDSKTEIRVAAKAAGWVWGGDDGTRHIGVRGSDKSPHTQRFIGVPYGLTPELEAERVRAWHEHEAQLKKEQGQ